LIHYHSVHSQGLNINKAKVLIIENALHTQ
jgi:hypothetical protein